MLAWEFNYNDCNSNKTSDKMGTETGKSNWDCKEHWPCFKIFFIVNGLLNLSDQTWNLFSFAWLSLMFNSFLLVPVKAVLRYFRPLSLLKKHAEVPFQTKPRAMCEVLLQGSFICFPDSSPTPGFPSWCEGYRDRKQSVGGKDRLPSSPPWLNSPCTVPMRLWHIWLMGITSKGASGLSPAAELSADMMKPWTESDNFSSQMINAA